MTSPLFIDQCLFGYDDGHRLLASSQKIGSDAAFELTPLSDLVSGALFGLDGGYWTGLPAPKLGKYVLMRTWPAPEMRRPGCVWTHGLLIDPTHFEAIRDLGQLRRLARRPIHPAERDAYEHPIEFLPAPNQRPSSNPPRNTLARELFEAIYGDGGSEAREILCDLPEGLDELVFEVWSQQWPKLRRNFRFQTALLRGTAASATRFDIQFRYGHRGRAELQSNSSAVIPWLSTAIRDLDGASSGKLRAFLWRYGEGVIRQKGSFRPLCEIHAIGSGDVSAGGFPAKVANWFPDRDDARELKQDIVDGTIFPNLQLDFVEYALGAGRPAIPAPSKAAIANLGRFWSGERERLLDLATRAVDGGDDNATTFVAVVTAEVSPTGFWADMRGRPQLRKAVLANRPGLASSPGIETLETSELAEVLSSVSSASNVVVGVIGGLMTTASQQTALMLMDTYPEVVVSGVVSALDGNTKLSPWWLSALSSRPSSLLSEQTFAAINRTSTLYRLADVLGWMSSEVRRAGFRPWWVALDKAANDLRQDQFDELAALVLALALPSADRSSQAPFERLFGTVHASIVAATLPWRAQQFLLPLLPDVGWFRGWDTGLRLRLAIASAYVFNDLPPQSYASLSNDPYTLRLLEDAADEVQGGKRYAKAIRKG